MVNCLNKSLATLFSLFLILLMTSTAIIAAEITATVNRNPIPIGESFQLILNTQGSIDEDPDFSELRKKFRIINTSQNSSFAYFNGSITSTKNWTLTLINEEPGNHIIPAISFGKDKSNPISIRIVNNTVKNSSNENADIYLEVAVEPKTAYVQQQIIYSIKLFRRIRISNASLSEPVTENDQAVITKLGEDSDNQIVINGVNYSVLERRYALFPQKSGKLIIGPVTFETEIVRNNQVRSFFNSQRTIKRLKSKSIEIQIKGIPAAYAKKYPDAVWLPVDNLIITEAWSGDVNKFKSGEPMTRTINLIAQNLTVAQLPDIKLTTSKNIKIYPDVPAMVEQSNHKGLVAKKQFKIALLPTKTGQHRLDKIVIPWWNTRTNKMQEAILKSKTLTVSAATNQDDDHVLNINDDIVSQKSNTDVAFSEPVFKQKSVELAQVSSGSSLLWIIASIIFAVLWLVTFYLLMSLRKKLYAINLSAETAVVSKTVSTKEFKAACLDNNAKACSQLFLQWANNQTQAESFTNLSSLLPYASKELAQAIVELEQCLYGNKSGDWNGAKIWSAFDSKPPNFAVVERQNVSVSRLPLLYAKYK